MIVIIPDTAPLIHLAAAGLLELLPALGRVVVPDVIAMETTRLPDKPYAGVVGDWLESGAPETVPTEIGALYRIAIEQGIKPPRNSGELAIIEWLHGPAGRARRPRGRDLRRPALPGDGGRGAAGGRRDHADHAQFS